MAKVPFPLPKEYGLERDVQINSSQIINAYAIPTSATVEKECWVPASGYEIPQIVGTGDVRAQFVFRDIQYLVSGDEIYSRDSAGVLALLGPISAISGYVGITANEKQVIFVSGGNAYLWDTVTAIFAPVVFGFTITPADVTMLDNYFIIPDEGQQKFYVSALNNGAVWNVLDFAIFQSNPDVLVAVHTLKRRLYLFGRESIETWYDAGAPVFPFRRDNNALFEHGCVAPATIQEGFEVMLYLARNKDGTSGVMLVQGVSQPKKISSLALDYFLQNLSSPSDSSAILYKENGLTFYQLNFYADNATFLYVLETGRWSQLSLPNGDGNQIISHSYYINKHYVGIAETNSIFEFSSRFFTYNQQLIRFILISSQFFDTTNNRIRLDRLRLELTTGMPSVTLPIQYESPQVDSLIKSNQAPEAILSISRDGGRTFGNGRRESLGKYGDFLRMVTWRRLGAQRGRRIVIKIEIPYKIPFVVTGAFLHFEVLPE